MRKIGVQVSLIIRSPFDVLYDYLKFFATHSKFVIDMEAYLDIIPEKRKGWLLW